MLAAYGERFDLLLGRRTCDLWSGFRPQAPAVYRFNQHRWKHRFYPTCGSQPFAEGQDPQGNERAAIEIRCLEGSDLSAIPVTPYDGRSR